MRKSRFLVVELPTRIPLQGCSARQVKVSLNRLGGVKFEIGGEFFVLPGDLLRDIALTSIAHPRVL